jgi:ubiquinone/menaquinone biosynthesis C-methylase UbiE
MAAIAKTSRPLVKAFNLGQFKTHVDVGGGTGTFARQVADEYPDLEITVCDIERVIDTALTLPVNKNTRVNFVKG